MGTGADSLTWPLPHRARRLRVETATSVARPDETLLSQLIEEHWPTFLERAEQSGALPDFIVGRTFAGRDAG